MWNKIKSFLKSIQPKSIFTRGGFNIFSASERANKDFYYGIVLRCIDAIASGVASSEFHLYKEQEGKDIEYDNHPSYSLLQRPNNFFTNHDLFYLTTSHILTGGASFWYLVRNGNNDPVEIWPLPPDRVIINKGENFIDSYTFVNFSGQRIQMTTDEIIPIYRPNPFDWWKGVNLLKAVKHEVEADLNAIIWNANFFKYGAIPSGAFKVDTQLDDEKAEMIREQLKDFYMGRDNAHKVMILGQGQEYIQLAPRQKEMDFINQRTFSRDEILAIFNVPKTVIGITEDVNRANAEVSDYIFAKRNIKVWLSLIFEKINTFYLPKFKNVDGLYFDFIDPTPEDRRLELEENIAGVDKWLTRNEVRERYGLEPVEGGDSLYIPMSQIELGQENTTPEQPITERLKYMKKNDRVYLLKKRRIISTYQQRLKSKIQQQFKLLVRDIRKGKGKIEKIYKTKGSEQIVFFLKPILDNWEVLNNKIIFEIGKAVSEEAINLNKDVYNIPKISMDNILPSVKARADWAADAISNSIYDRAREIIARNLEDDIFDPDKIVDEIADVIDDETDYRAERIMRTEIAETFNNAVMEDYKSCGFVEKIKWICGDNPCSECQKNDDEIIELGGVFSSGDDAPPVHPNCECDVVPVI